VLNAPPSILYNGKAQVSPPDEQAQATEELPVVLMILFSTLASILAWLTKHSAKKDLSALLECFDFKFSGTDGDEKRSQVFDTLRAVR
jgi:hypothetical protein